MVGHNKAISKNHFHKDWTRWLRQNFDQVFRKRRRNEIRDRKSKSLAPRPSQCLQPIVRCPSSRYNRKQRLGRGFSSTEIRSVGLSTKEARSIGIKVDHRRRNKSVEGLMINKQRLRDYRSRLVLWPKKKTEAGRVCKYTYDVNENPVITKLPKAKARVVTEEEQEFSPFIAIRQAYGEIKKVNNREKKMAKKQVDDIK